MKAACEAIGSVALADDLGIKLRVRLHIDAAAALGILERQGVGRVRYLDIGVLWLQEHQLRRVVELTKVLGIENPADLMAKHLDQKLVTAVLNYEFGQGRSGTTARAQSGGREIDEQRTADTKNGVYITECFRSGGASRGKTVDIHKQAALAQCEQGCSRIQSA